MSPQSDKYQRALKRIEESVSLGIHQSLDGIRGLMQIMGNPHKNYPSIQIAGTNGKTSTARQIAGILHAHGYKTGLYSSPKLVDYTDCTEIDGEPVSHELFAQAIEQVAIAADELLKTNGLSVTEFEILTAASFLMFSMCEIDIAVIETGMGGTWDATSAIDNDIAVITGIGLDHLGILGNDEFEIAQQKAGIIHKNCKVILGPGTQKTQHIFEEKAAEFKCPVFYVREHGDKGSNIATYSASIEGSSETLKLNVHTSYADYCEIIMFEPQYQAQNAASAIAACEILLGRALDDDLVRRALCDVKIPGRFETLCEDPLLIIDAAHNPQSAQTLKGAISRIFPDGNFNLLFAVLADKDVEGIVEILCPLASKVFVTQTDSPRAMDRFELAKLIEKKFGHAPEVFETPSKALETLLSMQTPIVASGSITLAGAVKAAMQSNR